ncbi:MAG: leucine-rich repeat domain-containing protein, partial [Sodaliphilus sp.]|nr:leucine-rich repeat domain-containing protein [Sodaliphilus sp.]
GLTSVTIPNSVTSIGNEAFSRCRGLTSIKVESGNSVYDSRENCNAIIETATNTLISGCKNTIIPNSVTSIGNEAFWRCSGLTSVTIPKSVTEIGTKAFYCCFGLTSVTIPNSVTSIGERAFDGTAWYNNQPDGLVYAGLVAYKYKGRMPSGTSIVLKEGTKGIAGTAFWRCSGLTSVTIPNSVTEIGDYAFYGCSGLTSVTIGNSVTSIGWSAFGSCSGLTRINAYPNPEKVSIAAFAFSGVPKDVTLHVLPKYLSAYQTASEWKNFTNIKGDL